MNKQTLYLSTMDPHAHLLARKYGLGLEIAEYCTAWNMDDAFPQTHAQVTEKIKDCPRLTFHAPFNELFPCAIDPKARALAAERYRQAICLAKSYGAGKVVIHGGFQPRMYYPVWYVEQSVQFWREFLREDPGIPIVLENVLEEDPDWLLEIVREVNSPRLGLCLDVGHVNAYSPVPVAEWVERWQPWLSHFHLHNNDGSWDTHDGLNCGSIPMKKLLCRVEALCPEATITLELMDAQPSLRWLQEEHLWIGI